MEQRPQGWSPGRVAAKDPAGRSNIGEAPMRMLAALVVALALYGCGEGRRVGSVLDPVCAPDGSVVTYQIANSQGNYEGVQASRKNCPWNQ